MENFDTLLEKALREWPNQIVFGTLDIDTNPHYPRDSFSVEGLYDTYEKIIEKYINHEHEIIWANLHYSIYGVVHDAAKYVKKIDLSNLRTSEIKYDFEKKMQSFIDNKHGDCHLADIELAQEYFKIESELLKKKT